MPFPWWNNYYYLILIAQVCCIIHALKTGRREWILFLVILPLLSVVIYFVKELLPDINSGVFWENLQRIFFPNARLNDLERRVRISDTITNKMNLAEELMLLKRYDKAIAIAAQCLQQRPNDAGIILPLARMLFYSGRFEESIPHFQKALGVKHHLNNPADELLYARALEGAGNQTAAEEEYKRIIRLHHSLEGRYRYGLLLKQQRPQEAAVQFRAAADEIELHPRYVRRTLAKWARLSSRELKTLQ